MFPNMVVHNVEGLESPTGTVISAIEYDVDEGELSIRHYRSISSSHSSYHISISCDGIEQDWEWGELLAILERQIRRIDDARRGNMN